MKISKSRTPLSLKPPSISIISEDTGFVLTENQLLEYKRSRLYGGEAEAQKILDGILPPIDDGYRYEIDFATGEVRKEKHAYL